MANNEPFLWMGGVLATELVEIRHDFGALDEGGFWAVIAEFDGGVTCARFDRVVTGAEFPSQSQWQPLTGKWRSTLSKVEYLAYVESIRESISLGDVYQVNACRILEYRLEPDISLAPLFSTLIRENPAPHSCYLRLPDLEIASASPELFLRKRGSELLTSPIKGTRAPTNESEPFSEKDRSENLMIVDLMRNDLNRVSAVGTVKVNDFLRHEAHPGLEHLVADVTSTAAKYAKVSEITSELLPPGSVSGAPKHSALKIIRENEGATRGPYCGAIGYVWDGDIHLNVGIRTFWKSGELLKFGTGAGITWGSDPASEWAETELKCDRLISLAGGLR